MRNKKKMKENARALGHLREREEREQESERK